MTEAFLREISDRLQRERRALVQEVKDTDETFHAITETRQSEGDKRSAAGTRLDYAGVPRRTTTKTTRGYRRGTRSN